MATENDKVNTAALATLVAVGVFGTLAIALGVDALVRHESGKMRAERAGLAEKPVHELVREQRQKLDAQPLPIDRAMAAVVLDLRQNPWSATPPAPEKDAGSDAAVAPEETVDGGVELTVTEEPAPTGGGSPAPSAAPAPAPSVPAAPAPALAPGAPEPKAPAPKPIAPTAPVTAPTPVKAPAPAPTAAAPKPLTPIAAPATPAPAPVAPTPKPADG